MSLGLGFQNQPQELDRRPVKVAGTIPDWLNGTLLRIAPAIFEVGGRRYNHWFDGLAKLHRFAIANGEVSYSSRFVRSGAYCDAMRTGRIARREFATDPCQTIFGKLASLFVRGSSADNPNVNVDRLGGELVALTEGSPPRKFDGQTLETYDAATIPSEVGGQISIAHPQHDADRKLSYSYSVRFGRRSSYRIFGIDPVGRARRLTEIETDRPCYMHSIGMSDRFVVLAEFPLCVNPLRLRFSMRPFIENYRWKPHRGLRFLLVDRDNGDVVTVHSDAAFAFHHVNAFDEGDEVVVDMAAYPDSRVIDQFTLDHLTSGEELAPAGMLTRYRLPVRGGMAKGPELLSGAKIELPRINPAFQRKRYRFAYGSGVVTPGNFLDSIVKIDMGSGEAKSWATAGCFPGEPVLVADPAGRREDEGLLLSVVLDSDRSQSFLLILDAQTMQECARATVPEIVTLGFHGNFFAS